MKTAAVATSRFETLVGDLAELIKARLSARLMSGRVLDGWRGR
jgi:hypothetical protein